LVAFRFSGLDVLVIAGGLMLYASELSAEAALQSVMKQVACHPARRDIVYF